MIGAIFGLLLSNRGQPATAAPPLPPLPGILRSWPMANGGNQTKWRPWLGRENGTESPALSALMAAD